MQSLIVDVTLSSGEYEDRKSSDVSWSMSSDQSTLIYGFVEEVWRLHLASGLSSTHRDGGLIL